MRLTALLRGPSSERTVEKTRSLYEPSRGDTCIPQVEPLPKYMPIAEWCNFSGLKLTSTYEALKRRDLTAIKIGRRTLIDVAAGLAWLASRPSWSPSVPVARRRGGHS